MTRVYPLVTIGVLSSDNAAAQLKRLAEQCGVSDADLAAIPDGPAERRSAKPLGDWARRATRAGSPAHRSENHAGRNAGGHSSACGHNGHKHGCYLRPGVVGAPGPERIRSGNHAEGHARRREFAHIHNADEHSGHLRPGHVAGAEPEKVTRRRRWAASGYLPPQIAARFTLAEQSVLSVISKQHMEHGRCALCIGAIAARAGVGRTTVQNALRVARRLGLASVQERRYRGRKSETNVVMIVSKEWTSWLARRARSAKARDAASSRSGSVIACPTLDTGRSSVPRAMAQESAHSIQKPEPVESTSKIGGGFRDERENED
jgi:hypothetical protein